MTEPRVFRDQMFHEALAAVRIKAQHWRRGACAVSADAVAYPADNPPARYSSYEVLDLGDPSDYGRHWEMEGPHA